MNIANVKELIWNDDFTKNEPIVPRDIVRESEWRWIIVSTSV